MTFRGQPSVQIMLSTLKAIYILLLSLVYCGTNSKLT